MRLIDKDGEQLGIVSLQDALAKAELSGLDLVEIAPNAEPPVCKVIDYGKYRYQVTKKEKEGKKSQHQVKVKEIKIKPNTDDNDIEVKTKGQISNIKINDILTLERSDSLTLSAETTSKISFNI